MGRVASTKSLTSRLEHFAVSAKRRNAQSLCSCAIPDGKPRLRFPGIASGALLPLTFLAALVVAGGLWLDPALALSEIKREPSLQTSPPPADGSVEKEILPPAGTVPIPDTSTTPSAPSAPDEAAPDETPPADESAPADEEAAPGIDPNAPPPEVLYDLSKLPEPVRRLHDRIIEICKSGDVEKLRPFLETGENATQLSFGGVDGDPIAYLKESSGDKQGHEMLAILEEVLSAGYVHLDPGTPNEMFVWPYFFAVPLDKLTAPQQVELFKIVTAGDYEEMKTYGTYIFYRVGITPEGRWSFFVAGD